jgi:hypothetical protein
MWTGVVGCGQVTTFIRNVVGCGRLVRTVLHMGSFFCRKNIKSSPVNSWLVLQSFNLCRHGANWTRGRGKWNWTCKIKGYRSGHRCLCLIFAFSLLLYFANFCNACLERMDFFSPRGEGIILMGRGSLDFPCHARCARSPESSRPCTSQTLFNF